jgi:hypothetical protein
MNSEEDEDEWQRGYDDGYEHAEHEHRDGIVGSISDILTGYIHYDGEGSEKYKEGWEEGYRAYWEEQT